MITLKDLQVGDIVEFYDVDYCIEQDKKRLYKSAFFVPGFKEIFEKEQSISSIGEYFFGIENDIFSYTPQWVKRVTRGGKVVIDEELFEENHPSRFLTDEEINELVDIQETIKSLKSRETELKEKLLEGMESTDIKKLDSNEFTVTYKAPSMRRIADSKLMKDEGIWDDYSKVSKVGASVSIKLNEK